MKKKKIIARIGAILASVLLLASLALPAFADEQAATQAESTVPLGTAMELFGQMLGTEKTDAYDNLFSRYLGYGDTRFFTMDYLVTGHSSAFSVALPLDISVGEDTTSIFAQIPVDMMSYVFYTNSNTPAYINTFDGGRINIAIYADSVDGYMVQLFYSAEGEQFGKFAYTYKGLTQSSLTLQSITVEGDLITPTYTSAEIAFTIARASSEWSPLLSTVCALLFDQSAPIQLDNVLFSPRQFYYGLNQAYNLGNDEGYRLGYNNGQQDGYEQGLEEGYLQGVNTDAYQDGYDQAVSEIESGDFGRNFLGGILSSPFTALEQFELVKWTTQGGNEITISLAQIVSAAIGIALFIWFLKLFAGG